MKHFMKIMDVNFEVVNPKVSNIDHYNTLKDKPIRHLDTCYNKPSARKISIYTWWLRWFSCAFACDGMQDLLFKGVRSYNTNIFTLQGTMVYNNEKYIIDITPSHNYLIKVF